MLSLRRTAPCAFVLAMALFLSGVVSAGAAPKPGNGDNVVVQWNKALLAGVRASRLGPPMVARALAMAHTCMYDAWAPYDQRAVGTRLGGSLRQKPNQRGEKNIEKAISFGAYRAAVDLMPASKVTVFDPLMASLGYDPTDTTTDTATPAGVGNVACKAVLDFRHHDGSNQLGDEPGGKPGVAYSDYTGYTPQNAPMNLLAPFDPSTVHDPNHWQPLTYVDASGATVTPAFVTPFWTQVKPFALTSGAELRPTTGPAQAGTAEFVSQAQALLDISANLTDEQKVIAEYWADGPRSELPPGHWNLIAQFVSHRDHHGTKEDVKMFFALTNAIFDAGIYAWDSKRAFDSVRPITAIRYLFQGQTVQAWAGPNQGTKPIDGATWLPYQPSTFPTPPFAEYSSGHSAFSAAGAETLKLFTGSDTFGTSATLPAGSSTIEPGTVPASDVTLSWATFSDAADQAGISRRYGGIHFEQGDLDSRATGRVVADESWQKAQSYFNGTAATP